MWARNYAINLLNNYYYCKSDIGFRRKLMKKNQENGQYKSNCELNGILVGKSAVIEFSMQPRPFGTF